MGYVRFESDFHMLQCLLVRLHEINCILPLLTPPREITAWIQAKSQALV